MSEVASDQVGPPAVNRRLPGRARPQREALQEYREHVDRVRAAIDERWGEHPVMVQFLRSAYAPDPEERYRWRIELDCGCIREVLTRDKDDLPSEKQWRDPVLHESDLSPGQVICLHSGGRSDGVYREIIEWGPRKEDRPPDRVEPPEHYADVPEVWAKIRHDHPRAEWTVTLSCGHTSTVRVDDLAWEPSNGIARREASSDELAAQLARLNDAAAEGVPVEVVDHGKRWWHDGCPVPDTESMCFTCRHARSIVAYERVGSLSRPKQQPTTPAPQAPSRASVERRLRDAERQVAELQGQLAQLDENDGP